MEHHVGINVLLQLSSLCMLDTAGTVVREAKVASEPEALVGFLRKLRLPVAQVGLEAGPLSQWLQVLSQHFCHQGPLHSANRCR